MTTRWPSRQRGIILLALTLILLLAASIMLIRRANRQAPAPALQLNVQAPGLDTLLGDIRQQLIATAATEDNTPGTMPCPDGTLSCGDTADGLSGNASSISAITHDASITLNLPDQTLSSVCLQYVLAPTLRNTLHTDTRGSTQKQVNPDLQPGLTVVDAAGNSSSAWAALIANAPVSTCSLDALGYQLNVNGNTATLSASTSSASNARLMLIQTRNILPALYTQVLQSLDTASFSLYLETHTTATVSLATLRSNDPSGFDAALAPSSSLQSSSASSSSASAACPVVVTSASSSSASSGTTSAKFPVSWLCFNGWYNYVSYAPSTKSLIATDTTSGLKCKRQSGITTCSY